MQKFKDFKVEKRAASTVYNYDKWIIKAGGVLISMYNSEEEANFYAECLNKDPWYFDRKPK